MTNKDIVQAIKTARKRLGLTQTDLAEKMGVTRSAVAVVESGAHGTSVALLRRIAEALECDLKIDFKPKDEGATN